MKPIEIPVPPAEIAVCFGPNYYQVGLGYLSLLRQTCELKPDSSVLEVGCGTGRIAGALTGYLSDQGSYRGFDIVESSIDWCRAEITSRYPRFEFQHANIFNGSYNDGGETAGADFVFPYEDNRFDLVFLTSVFTHMLPDEIIQYLRQIVRVLKPGGHCLITYFLINQESEGLIASGKASRNREFPHHRGDCRLSFPKNPEAVVAYEEDFIRKRYIDAGLSIAEIRYGAWCGRGGVSKGFTQDAIAAVNSKN